MNEEKKNTWDVVISIISMILTISTIFVGIHQFNSQQAANQKLEFEREFYKMRVENYSKICENVGILVSEYTDDSTFSTALKDFERYYWSTINIPPDTAVTKAIMEFRETLKHVDRKIFDGHYSLAFDAANLQDSCYVALQRNWILIDK